MLPFPIKASGITHLTDARYFAAWYVDYLGFPIDGAEPVSGPQLAAMREWIEGPKILAELTGPVISVAELTEELFRYGLLEGPTAIDGLQFRQQVEGDVLVGGTRPAEVQKNLQAHGLEVWYEIEVAHHLAEDDLEACLLALAPHANGIVLNLDAGGMHLPDLLAGHGPSLERLQQWSAAGTLFLDLAVGAKNLDEWQKHFEQTGLVVRGGAEEQVGYKSFEELDELFDALAD